MFLLYLRDTQYLSTHTLSRQNCPLEVRCIWQDKKSVIGNLWLALQIFFLYLCLKLTLLNNFYIVATAVIALVLFGEAMATRRFEEIFQQYTARHYTRELFSVVKLRINRGIG